MRKVVERGKMSEIVMIKMNREGVKKEMHMTTFYIMTVTCPSNSPLTREICVRESKERRSKRERVCV